MSEEVTIIETISDSEIVVLPAVDPAISIAVPCPDQPVVIVVGNAPGATSGGTGDGDVVGPASAVDGNVVLFSTTTGKIIKDSGLSLAGSNTGDVAIGTANGLSIVGQVLSLQAATNSVPGALTAADHTTFAAKEPAITAGTIAQYFRGDKSLSTFATDALAATPAETASTIGTITHGVSSKNPPLDADEVTGNDSAASFGLTKFTWANIKAFLKTYFDGLYPSGSGTSTGTNTGDQTGGTPALTLGTTNTAGSSTNFIRRDDTVLVFDATAPTTQAFSDAAAVGTATVAARRDHKHGMMATPDLSSYSHIFNPVAIKTANYTANVWEFIPCDVSAGSFTVQLPTGPANGSALTVTVAVAGSVGVVEVKTGGTDVFVAAGGETSFYLGLQNEGVILHYQTSSGIWFVESAADSSNFSVGFPGVDAQTPITNADISINYTTRVLTVTPPLGYFNIFVDGGGKIKRYRKTTVDFPVFTDTSGIWYFYFDSVGVATTTQTAWTVSDFSTIAPIYRILWNATLTPDATKAVAEYVEYHQNTVPASQRAWQHLAGAVWSGTPGFDSSSNVLSSGVPNADGRNAVIGLKTGTNLDDNLTYTVTNDSTPTNPWEQDLGDIVPATLNATNSGQFQIYTQDVAGLVSFLPATRFPFSWNSGTNLPEYISSVGVSTSVPNLYFFVYFIYATQNPRVGEAIKIISAPAAYSTLTNAEAYTWTDIHTQYPTLLDDPEIRPMYRMIFEHRTIYDVGTKKSVMRELQDLRKGAVTSTAVASGSLPASSVTFIPTGDIAATNVQSALVELDTEKVPITKVAVSTAMMAELATGFTLAGGTTTKTLTVPLDASVSGTNTGDQTTISGNAGSATYASAVTTANEATDTTCYVGFVTDVSGNLPLKTNTGLSYNSNTSILTATGFSGPLTGNVTGNVSGSSGSCTGNAATVTTNANLTGTVTSVGNATAIASGAIKANMLQTAAEDLGAANVTINLGNTNGAFVTNVTTDGTVTAGGLSAGTGVVNGGIITALTQLISDSSSDTAIVCPLVDLRRARDGNPTDDISDNDYLGEIRFRGYKTDGYYEGAIIRAVVNGTPGAADMPTELIFATSADGSATPTTRLTIDATGLATFANGITGSLTGNVTGNADTVTTNANLTGDVTSIGNATTLTNAPVIAKVLTGYVSGAGTVAATDSILQAIQKLNGNDATNANLTGPITSVGNATSIASQTGTGSTFVMSASPTFTGTAVCPAIDGSIADNGDLTLQGTSSATRSTSYVNIQPNGGNVNIGTTEAAGGYGARLGIVSWLVKTEAADRLLSFRSSEALVDNPIEVEIDQIGSATASLQGMGFQTGHYGSDFAAVLCFQYNGGTVGIGTKTPAAVLHIKAGTATAGTAPLKLTTGTVNTTAEVGAVEYNNTFHVTNSDATRRHVVTAPNTTKVTAAAPYTNDGYVVMNIGGTDFKVMTTA